TAFDLLRKPAWALNIMTSKRRSFGNLEGRIAKADSLTTLSQWIAGQFDPTLSWKDVEWVKKLWGGPLVLKGILDAEDAKIAAQTGADAIVVSNHGGRQLDGAVSSIRALPEIAAAVGDKIDVWFDGGIRSGQSLLKALARGAKAAMIGRAFVYGLGARGEAGVLQALQVMAQALEVAGMAVGAHRGIRVLEVVGRTDDAHAIDRRQHHPAAQHHRARRFERIDRHVSQLATHLPQTQVRHRAEFRRFHGVGQN